MKYKKIIALILCFVIFLTSFVSAQAVNLGEVGSFVATTLFGFALEDSWMSLPGAVEATERMSEDPCATSPTGHHVFGKHLSPRPGAPSIQSDVCTYCGVTMDSFYAADYDQYVSDLQTDLGSHVVGNGSVPFYFTSDGVFRTSNWDSIPSTKGKITTIDNWLVPSTSDRMSDVQAMFEATLAIFKLEFTLYGFTFTFWNVLLFSVVAGMILYFIGGLFK